MAFPEELGLKSIKLLFRISIFALDVINQSDQLLHGPHPTLFDTFDLILYFLLGSSPSIFI